jgi:ribulose-5-phosphate 4-epimerase/fuculose-1-phosphate aldolase
LHWPIRAVSLTFPRLSQAYPRPALPPLRAKEHPMAVPVHFDPQIGEQFLRYARLVAARGYVHNTLGNMAIRAAHPDYPHGVAYTKHAEISLEEMGLANIVITDIPTSRLLYGSRMTSIGHNLNREILRLRPDIGAVIHVHDDATIAFFGSGAFREIKVLSLDMPFILGKPPYYVPAHVDVEADVGPVKDFIAETNVVVLLGHGITALGRTISEAYHRLNSLTAEIRRNVQAEQLAALKGTSPLYRSAPEIALMYRHAEAVIYPSRAEKVMQGDAA